jgi:hypothetical protein
MCMLRAAQPRGARARGPRGRTRSHAAGPAAAAVRAALCGAAARPCYAVLLRYYHLVVPLAYQAAWHRRRNEEIEIEQCTYYLEHIVCYTYTKEENIRQKQGFCTFLLQKFFSNLGPTD